MSIDPHAVSSLLERASSATVAQKRMKQVQPLKGVRGVPFAELSRLLARTWRQGIDLAEDADAIHELFCTAHEDGLVALGLAAAAVEDEPEEALELAERWLDMVDDLETADALGWLLWGPALRAVGEPVGTVVWGRLRGG